MKYAIFFIMTFPFFFACQNTKGPQEGSGDQMTSESSGHAHGDANHHMNQRPLEDLVEHFESPERAEWQKPDSVIAFLGELEGKTVMDIGSGSGYFSFRLARAGATVISADVDERFLEYIEQKKQQEGWTDEQIETRKVPYDSPNLQEAEVDLVFVVDVYHHIEQRPAYFGQVKKGLKPGGRLVVIDFFKKEIPVGPPVEMKLKPEQVMNELKNAGFTDIEVNETLLPYQYIVTAS